MAGRAQEPHRRCPEEEAEAIDPGHRTYQPVSVRGPALIVLGIAVFIVVIGTVASALATSGAPPGPTGPSPSPTGRWST